MSKFKFGDKVRPLGWTPQPLAVVVRVTEGGVGVVFDPADTGGKEGVGFFFVDECVELDKEQV